MNKIIRFSLILLVLLGVGAYLIYRNQEVLPLDKLPQPINQLLSLGEVNELGKVLGEATTNVDKQNLNLSPESVSSTLNQGAKGLEEAKKFFNGFIQVDESKGKNTTDRAIKYAAYVYCKQVVDQWEGETNLPPTNYSGSRSRVQPLLYLYHT